MFAWTFRFTQVKFLSCCDGFEKNKFQGFWQYIYVGTAKNSFTVKLFQDGNRDVTCFFLFVYLGEFLRFWLSSDSHKEQLLSTHSNTQKKSRKWIYERLELFYTAHLSKLLSNKNFHFGSSNAGKGISAPTTAPEKHDTSQCTEQERERL